MFRAVQPAACSDRARARLQRRDLSLLLTIAIIGGGAGPVLMLVGLGHLSGVAGSLLLNLEAVFTMLLAVLFGERLSRGETGAAAIVLTGAMLLSLGNGRVAAEFVGVAAIVGACLAWGLDNNLTARLAHRNAVDLVCFKSLTAGLGNPGSGAGGGPEFPEPAAAAAALAVGFVCYGLSIVLDVYALRYIGAAREAAFFATAPFAGAIGAVPLLGERIGIRALPQRASWPLASRCLSGSDGSRPFGHLVGERITIACEVLFPVRRLCFALRVRARLRRRRRKGGTRTPAASAPWPPAPVTPIATTKQIMQAIVSPTSTAIFQSVQTNVTLKGTEEIFPRSDEEWALLGAQAAALAEAGHMLMAEGRASTEATGSRCRRG